jgi:RNA polymerase sigma factor for flagellar operon FliA
MDDVTLSRADLQQAELPPYPGIALADITLVTAETEAAAARAALLAADVIGFDTESKPTFLKGEVSTGPHLVQLATDTHAWLFPVSDGRVSAVVSEVLAAPQVRKVGFGLGNDRSVLRSRLGIEVQNLLDLGEKLRGPGHKGTVGAKVAVAHFFGQRLQKSKKTGTSNWANPRLTERQLLYAANDAHVALRLYRAWRASNPPEDAENPLPLDGGGPGRG